MSSFRYPARCLLQNLTKIAFGKTGGWTGVVSQIEMSDAQIEGRENNLSLIISWSVPAKIMP